MNKVLVAAPISSSFQQALVEKGYELLIFDKVSNEDVLNASGVITSNKLILNQSELKKYPNLKWIARLGSGMEIIDTKYCDAKGIYYFSSPNGIANSVAEHMTGMLLSLLHKIHSSFEEIKNREWIREPNRGNEVSGKTIGIIGYGHTGTAFANKMSVFTNKILVYDKYKTGFGNEFVQEVSLEMLQQHADIISFHVPLNEETNYYYNDDFLSKMKHPHILLNSSRGAVANTNTIIHGLQSEKISGACLDVLEEEKEIQLLLKKEHNIISKLLRYNVLITPHIAGYSYDAITKMSEELLEQLVSIL